MIRLRKEGGDRAPRKRRWMYRAVSGVCAAQVRTRARTEVSKVTFRLVDPLPAQVLSEVDVKRTHAAVLLQVPETQHWHTVNLEKGLKCACMMQLPEEKGYDQWDTVLACSGSGEEAEAGKSAAWLCPHADRQPCC